MTTIAAPTIPDVKTTKTEQISLELIKAYWKELETVQNYLANSVDLVGVRAERIKAALAEEVNDELGHAQQLAERIHVIGGRVPGSQHFRAEQQALQPPTDPTDVVAVIQGVIEAETDAINQYTHIIELCEGVDYATQDLCIALLADEEGHRRKFMNYLTEYEH